MPGKNPTSQKNNNNNNNNNGPKPKRNRGKRSVNLNSSTNRVMSKETSAPLSMGTTFKQNLFKVRTGSKPDSLVCHGHEYIGLVQTGASASQGANLRTDYICPGSSMFAGTRVEKFADMYDKYLFRKFKAYYVPSCASTTSGSICLSIDKDYADSTPPATESGVRQLMSFQNASMIPAWCGSSVELKITDLQKFYYTNDTGYDGRLVYQGQLYTACGTALPINTVLGSIVVEYEVEFFDPQLDQSSSYTTLVNSGVVAVGTGGSGWNNLLNVVIGSGIRPISDQNGNKGFVLPQGNWILEQIMLSASANGCFVSPTAIVNQFGQLPTITNTYAPANNNANTVRIDKVQVPFGGSALYGNASASLNAGSPMLRIFEAFTSQQLY